MPSVCSVPAFAQMDLSGAWGPLYQEDFDERIPGPALVDYLMARRHILREEGGKAAPLLEKVRSDLNGSHVTAQAD